MLRWRQKDMCHFAQWVMHNYAATLWNRCSSSTVREHIFAHSFWKICSGWLDDAWHSFRIGLVWELWLGCHRTFTFLLFNHSCVVLTSCSGSLSCWKVRFPPKLYFLSRLSCSISLYFFIVPPVLQFWQDSEPLLRKISTLSFHPHTSLFWSCLLRNGQCYSCSTYSDMNPGETAPFCLIWPLNPTFQLSYSEAFWQTPDMLWCGFPSVTV